MGAVRSFSVNALADVTLVTTAETVIATLAGISTQDASEQVVLEATAQILTGTLTTAVTLRIRRGTAVTDPLVGEGNPVGIGAAVVGNFALSLRDTPGYVAGQSYVLTAQQTAATGNGVAQQSNLTAQVGG